ncbi:hypothetical protein [uncultured Desulfosarcina sp.]|uniref:hypothetical protein n=1 Tax=uncultured Desulfosarcina sp. TaxID=218289 RepID=UPI0029C64DC3|nr:hypothetical protein [uncultured Desulfosarcina sp.]
MNLHTVDSFIELYINDGLSYYEVNRSIELFRDLIGDFQDLIVYVSSEKCTLSYRQLRLIIEKGLKKMKRCNIGRIGIVVNTSLQAGMVRLFVEGLQEVECSFGVFNDKKSALDWLFER